MKKTGIYRIYNTKTDKSYVGQAIDIEVRWNGHKRELEEGCHYNVLLQRDWDKYGKSSFEFSILTECNPVELNVLEKLYMDLYNCTNAGYNVAEGNKKISKKYREELLSKEKRPNKYKNIKVENIVDKKENDDKKKNTEISSLKLLKSKDRALGVAIDKIGHINREVDIDLFSSVVHHIIGQQISTTAQATIWKRIFVY